MRTLSRTIYVFVLVALIMLWVPAVLHIDRFPFALGFGVLAAGTAASFSVRVAIALLVAIGGVAVAFAAVAFVPSTELPQTLPVAIIITVAARITATARLRSPVSKNQRQGGRVT